MTGPKVSGIFRIRIDNRSVFNIRFLPDILGQLRTYFFSSPLTAAIKKGTRVVQAKPPSTVADDGAKIMPAHWAKSDKQPMLVGKAYSYCSPQDGCSGKNEPLMNAGPTAYQETVRISGSRTQCGSHMMIVEMSCFHGLILWMIDNADASQ
jgi:hypothetical protein